MNERTRYIIGAATAVIVHLLLAVAIGLFSMLLLKPVPVGDILQVTLDSGGGKSGGGDVVLKTGSVQKNAKKTVHSIVKRAVSAKPENKVQEQSVKERTQTNVKESQEPNETPDEASEEQGEEKAGVETGGETGNGSGEGENAANGTGTGNVTGAGHGQGSGVPVTPPRVISKVLPHYPPTAKIKETTGVTQVTALVNSYGTVEAVQIVRGSGSSTLDQAALNAAYKWKFIPAIDRYGVPAACRITFSITFKLNG